MNLLIQEMTESDLEHLIEKTIRKVLSSKHLDEAFTDEALKVNYKESLRKDDRYLTRRETASMLKISLVTLSKLTSSGKLKSYRIGKRVLFKVKDIEKALVPIVNSKFKKL